MDLTLHGVTISYHFVNPALKILLVYPTSQKETGRLMVTELFIPIRQQMAMTSELGRKKITNLPPLEEDRA